MKTIKSRIAATISAASVALGGVAVPSLSIKPMAMLALGGAGVLASQAANAEAGWRVCGVAGSYLDSNKKYVNKASIIMKIRTSNLVTCNDTSLGNIKNQLVKQVAQLGNLGTLLGYDTLDMARCETLPERIGAPKKDICESMSSGQNTDDAYLTVYRAFDGSFQKAHVVPL